MLKDKFIEQAMRTNADTAGKQAVSPDAVHAVLGFISETNEFMDALIMRDRVNMMEELGDLFWFTALFETSTGTKVPYMSKFEDIDPMTGAGTMADLLKAAYVYGGKKDKSIADLMHKIAQQMAQQLNAMLNVMAAEVKNDDLNDVAERAQVIVINKLKARYPDKFSTRHAIERDIGYEREVLETSTGA